MTDYECPACGGGFPTADADSGECPWCGETMAAGNDDGPTTPAARQQPIPDDLDRATPDLDDLIEDEPVIPLRRQRRPVTPHWDSGVRVDRDPNGTNTR